MQIVIDSNVLFSALIRDSATREIILSYDSSFLFPSFIFEELEAHKRELSGKSGLNDEEFEALLNLILNKVTIIREEDLLKYKKKAVGLVNEIDTDDAMFVACSLAYPGSVIWSNDKRLKQIKGIKVITTKEIIRIIES